MKKKQLPFDFEFESDIIGIVTALTYYRFIHFANEHLNLNLKRIEDHEVYDNKLNVNAYFIQFYFKDELNKREIYVIKNKSSVYYCLPEFKKFDYLFLSPEKVELEILKQDNLELKQIPNIHLTKIITAELIKNKQNIFLDASTF